MHLPKIIFQICIAAVLLVENDEKIKFLFYRKSFHWKEMRCKQSHRRHLLLQETKTRISSYVSKHRKRKK